MLYFMWGKIFFALFYVFLAGGLFACGIPCYIYGTLYLIQTGIATVSNFFDLCCSCSCDSH